LCYFCTKIEELQSNSFVTLKPKKMKNFINKSALTYLLIVLTFSLTLSCSSDHEISGQTNDTYLSIPDIYFETKLIEQGIDSDGIVNQQMLKTDANKISILDLNLYDVIMVKLAI